jgi:hypothetical protein
MLSNYRFDVGRNAAETNSSVMNLMATKSEKTSNHCVKKMNVANSSVKNSSVKNSSVKKRAPNAQVLSVNGPHDALTHSMSRRAYY